MSQPCPAPSSNNVLDSPCLPAGRASALPYRPEKNDHCRFLSMQFAAIVRMVLFSSIVHERSASCTHSTHGIEPCDLLACVLDIVTVLDGPRAPGCWGISKKARRATAVCIELSHCSRFLIERWEFRMRSCGTRACRCVASGPVQRGAAP